MQKRKQIKSQIIPHPESTNILCHNFLKHFPYIVLEFILLTQKNEFI